MSLDQALTTDRELKDKFQAAITAKGKLDAAIIGKLDRCPLGQWLYGEAERKYPFLKSFKPCVEAHAALHQQAAKVVRQINGSEYADASAMLDDKAAYAKAFATLEAAVVQLKKDAKL